jgi:hypothetical protein
MVNRASLPGCAGIIDKLEGETIPMECGNGLFTKRVPIDINGRHD